MTHTNVTIFKKNLYSYLRDVIDFKDIINVSTKHGNAIVISEEEYNGMIATISLGSDPVMKKKIVVGLHTNLEDCEALTV